MRAHQEEGSHQQGEAAPVQAHRTQDHDRDLRELDQAYQERFRELVGDLPGSRGKEKKRQDEYRLSEIRKSIRVEPAQACRVKGDEYDQGVLVDVVVEGAEELRQEKREKAPLLQQLVLAMPAHGRLA